jgi:hypothetical protein
VIFNFRMKKNKITPLSKEEFYGNRFQKDIKDLTKEEIDEITSYKTTTIFDPKKIEISIHLLGYGIDFHINETLVKNFDIHVSTGNYQS